MKLGAEPKKVAILGGLLATAGIVFWINSGSSRDGLGPSNPAAPPAPGLSAPPQGSPAPGAMPPGRARRSARGVLSDEFKPTLSGKQPIDPAAADPALRLDILARLKAVTVEGTRRNVFEFSSAPPPPPAATGKPGAPKPPVANPLLPVAKPDGAATAKTDPPKPPPAPIPLKFFGYINAANQAGRRAFFLEGEDIHVVHEGDLVKRRYKIVRIGVNSVLVEDVETKNQQTLPIEEQPG